MIESVTNQRVKYVRRLQSDRRFRRREALFVAEGSRWLRDIIATSQQPQQLFATESWLKQPAHQSMLNQFERPPSLVTESVMAAMSDTATPAGILALLPISPATLPSAATLLLILDEISDPGNLGTTLRSAAAAGVDAVLLTPGCVDPYNPKVVRSSMGALSRVPIIECTWNEVDELTEEMPLWLAAGEAQQAYTAVDWCEPAGLIVGSEAHGASEMARQRATGAIAIPVARATESLNAAVAASIILFEAARQRQQT